MTPRQRKFFFTTFAIVFVLCVLMTIFTPSTYEAEAVIPIARPFPDKGPFPLNEVALVAPAQKRLSFSIEKEYIEAFTEDVKDRPLLIIRVWGTNPEHCAAFANALAETYPARLTIKGEGIETIHHARVPDKPIRPKRVQNIMFGAFLAGFIGLFSAQIIGILDRYSVKNALPKKEKGRPVGPPLS